jgi:dTDP-4-dehydrorhamnose reductase
MEISCCLDRGSNNAAINVYGYKRAGELACLESKSDAVMWTSWVYSRFGNNFVKNNAAFVAGTRYS